MQRTFLLVTLLWHQPDFPPALLQPYVIHCHFLWRLALCTDLPRHIIKRPMNTQLIFPMLYQYIDPSIGLPLHRAHHRLCSWFAGARRRLLSYVSKQSKQFGSALSLWFSSMGWVC